MGCGGMGTPLPHPSFISKFIIIFPVISKKDTPHIFTGIEMEELGKSLFQNTILYHLSA